MKNLLMEDSPGREGQEWDMQDSLLREKQKKDDEISTQAERGHENSNGSFWQGRNTNIRIFIMLIYARTYIYHLILHQFFKVWILESF